MSQQYPHPVEVPVSRVTSYRLTPATVAIQGLPTPAHGAIIADTPPDYSDIYKEEYQQPVQQPVQQPTMQFAIQSMHYVVPASMEVFVDTPRPNYHGPHDTAFKLIFVIALMGYITILEIWIVLFLVFVSMIRIAFFIMFICNDTGS